MSDTYILDDRGEPVCCSDLLAWGQWLLQNRAARQVARDEIGEVIISTVFLALNQNLSSKGAPVLWETMVFGGPLDGEQQRYTSKQDALAAHSS